MDRRSLLALAAVAGSLTAALALPAGPRGHPRRDDDPLAVLFETKVRPLLVGRCEECHAETEDGGLRVDVRESFFRGGDSGPAVVPGDPDASLLIQVVRHTHPKLRMPKRRAKLSDAEIKDLEEWVRLGAWWPDPKPAPEGTPASAGILPEQRAFWSFQPLGEHAAPPVRDEAWPRTSIDRFVLARLEQEGLAPIEPADKPTLLRRVTLGLTGLPPTPEELDAFVADEAPDAWEKVVERLLASPRYGETWARWWLDVARFGEDDCRSLDPSGRGYASYPNAYLYRDWVVQALNDDLPYDRFVTAQLAGDLMDEQVRARVLPALGFLGLGPWYYDNGSVEVTRADERHDRVDAVTRGFLGLTVACARCHDHKYDPISTADYHALAGVFLNTSYHEYPQVPKALAEEWTARDKRIEKKEKLLGEFQRTEGKQLAQTLAFQTARYMRAAWQVTGEPKKDKARVAGEEKLDLELFERWLAFLAKPPKHYPYLQDWQALIAAGGTKARAAELADKFQALLLEVLFETLEIEAENDIIRAKALPGTKKKERANLPHEFLTNDDFCPGCGLELKSLPIERTNLYTDVFSQDLAVEFGGETPDERMGKPGLLVFRGWGLERQLSADRRKVLEELREQIQAERKELGPKFPYVHGVRDVPSPQPIRIHVRGSPFRLGEEVPRRFLPVLVEGDPEPFEHGSGRLELAQAILAEPLAMRVLVNRVWKAHFGTGIVATSSDFGSTGERPSHPELLDHLARRFVESGLSLKTLQREILTSSVYRLASRGSEEHLAKDAGNRLYWRMSPRRMSAEQIRDSLLFVSGALEEKPAGPSEPLNLENRRRTLYGRVSRYRLDEFLALFDVPSPASSSEGRFTTEVPLQRLFFMNSDFMQQQGELLAKRVADEPDEGARIAKVYRLAFGRAPSEEETAAGLAFLRAEPMRQYEEHKAAQEAKKKAAEEQAPPPEAGTPPAMPAAGAAAPVLMDPTAVPKPERARAADDASQAPPAAASPAAPGPAAPSIDPAAPAAAVQAAPAPAAPPAPSPGAEDKPEEEASEEPPGMMSGVRPGAPGKEKAKLLPVTVWGRYAKVLLSSSEFLYIR